MYRFLDRPVSALAERELLVLRALRDWTLALHRGRCPVDAVTLRFLSHRCLGGIEPFHDVMCLLGKYGRTRFEMACPCSPRVSESEAMLLALFLPPGGASADSGRQLAVLACPRQHGRIAEGLAAFRSALTLSGFA